MLFLARIWARRFSWASVLLEARELEGGRGVRRGSSRITARGILGYLAANHATEELPMEWPMTMGFSSFSLRIRPARSSAWASAESDLVGGSERPWPRASGRIMSIFVGKFFGEVGPAEPVVG